MAVAGWTGGGRGASFSPSLALAALVALVGTSSVALLELTRSALAVPVAAFITGVIAGLCGLALVASGSLVPQETRFRRLLGIALSVWAAGQLLQGFATLVVDEPRFPLPGDVLSFFAAPFAVAGVVALPRRSSAQWTTLRLGLDSALLGTTVAFLAWELRFHEPFLDHAFTLAEGTAAVVLIADVTVVSLAVLAYLRDLDPNIGITAVGAACYSLGDLVTLYAALDGQQTWPWQGAVLWCLAWPLIAFGLLRHRPPAPRPRERLDPDARVSVVTTGLSLSLLTVGLVTMITGGMDDGASHWFIILAVAVFGARELLNARLRARLLQRLHDEATTDPLTGVSNRRVLVEAVGAVPPGVSWSVLRVDLEGFKEVNDLFGHETGDRVLCAVADRITQAAPVARVVSRVGGDDFGVLIEGDTVAGEHLARSLVDAVRDVRVGVGGREVRVTASVGVAAVEHPLGGSLGRFADPSDGVGSHAALDPLGPLSGADAALRRAQERGREQVATYEDDLAREHARRLGVEDRLRRTLAADGLHVAFQPIVDLATGALVGAEALARWSDPILGDVGPAEFIPVAEQTGLVVELGERVLEQSLAAVAEAGFARRGLRVSVNVSPLQLRVPGFDETVLEALLRHGVAPSDLVVEVTESVLVEEDGPSVACLRRLAAMGVTIAIDDFGSGYSALGYLGRLPAGVLKMDRSLARSLTASGPARAVAQAVIDVGRGLSLQVVLEGVESEDVADLAHRLGVGFGQGAWFGAPMSAGCVASLADTVVSRGKQPARQRA